MSKTLLSGILFELWVRSDIKMDTLAIDIEIFRKTPDVIRESQKKRFKSVELVDEVIKDDENWRKSLVLISVFNYKMFLFFIFTVFSGF